MAEDNPNSPSPDIAETPSQELKKPQRIYRLKLMVMVRILAEVAALAIVASLPLLFFSMGKFAILPMGWKIAFSIMSAVSLIIIPFYGFVTVQIKTDEDGITAVTALKERKISWSDLRSLVRRSTWNFPRYVVESASQDLSFPIWLESMPDLLEEIKRHLPSGSASFNPYRKFNQDPFLLGVQLAQAAGGILFVLVFWFFFAMSLKKGNSADTTIIFLFCTAATAAILWRSAMIVLMPLSVEVKLEFIVIKTLFFTIALPWEKVTSVRQTLPLLPEGFLIKTQKGTFLIGNGMDRSDELEQVLKDTLVERREIIEEEVNAVLADEIADEDEVEKT
jgi:hypothetical protein